MSSKDFVFLKRIRDEYRRSLKPPETEEVINQVLNRPAGFITAKFFDGLPFYRQERQFQCMGIDICRQDMANWSIRVHHRVVPFLSLLREQIRRGPTVGVDETSVQVLKEPGRPNTSQSYMWVFRGGMPNTV